MNSEIDLSTIPLDTGAPLVAEPDKRARELVYVPTRQHHSRLAVFVGALCRALVAAGFVSGIAYLFSDAMGIVPDKIGLSAVIVPAILFSIAIALMFIGKRFVLVGILAFIGAVFGELLSFSLEISEFVAEAAAALHNTVIERFMDAGQTGLRTLMIDTGESAVYSDNELLSGGIMLYVLLLSILLVPAVIKRCRVLYIVPVTALFTVPIFLYNIMRTNWGFALFVSASAGVLSLWLYDRRYTHVSRKKRLVGENEVMPDPLEGIEPAKSKKDKKRIRKTVKAARNKKKKADLSADDLRLESPKVRRQRVRNEKKQKAAAKKAAKKEKKNKKRNYRRAQILDADTARTSYAFGGITGLFAFALAAVAVVLPARFVESSDPGLPYISEIMSDARKYVTSFLSSDKIDLNGSLTHSELSNTGSDGSRSTEALYPSYKDVAIANVRVPYNTPVYLRTWIGTRYEDNNWYSATFDEIEDYEDRFGEDFTPESLTENFYDVVFPTYSRFPLSAGYRENVARGFISERVSVKRLSGNTPMLFLPSFVRPSVGLLTYGMNERTRMSYNIYYDGVWTSRYFFEDASYTTESLVTTMRSVGVGDVMSDEIKEYKATIELIRTGEPDKYIGADTETVERYIYGAEAQMAREMGIELPSISMLRRYLTTMSDEERQQVLINAELEERYADYVYETYTQTDDDNEAILDVTRSILSSYYDESGNGGVTGGLSDGEKIGCDRYHDVIMMLVEYLNDNYIYSKTRPEPTPETTGADETAPVTNEQTDDETDVPEPDEADTDEAEPDLSAVMEFLTETKTGYCVQFASSLTLMLRSLGIPARYCEGYLANGFELQNAPGTSPLMRYSTDVLDSDAHAWVEVYYDGLGWVQYEATPAMHDDMYGNLTITPSDEIGTNNDPGPNTGHLPPNVEHNNDDEVSDNNDDPVGEEELNAVDVALIVTAAVGVLIFIVLIVYVLVLRHRGRESCKRRGKLIERSKNTDMPMTDDEIRRDAHEINLGIYDIYAALGLPPRVGELSDEYASRLTPVVGRASTYPIPKVLDYISNEEFGHSITRDDLADLANYYGELTKNVYLGLSFRDRMKLRYIKRVV